ncbi:DUF397 domain-containing protein [Streptomyces sp. NBC_00893]|uniref:DUF397 domain-containing protein n=1 Tax=Streptomyces sp. NBC_00893 TaxID=2975862 RepID=UPI002254665D|nr:DUF397 domain-containing protein [Streptomyces sp. NBC_00893]MCX4846456.1 DUF397 domain-containing protein [Streptomyces sp. NBC_00893]
MVGQPHVGRHRAGTERVGACIHVAAAGPGSVGVTESGDPTGAILRTTPTAWAALVRTAKEDPTRGRVL